MKKQFSTSWKGSKQPRKQRKYRAKAPQHVKQKMLSAHLSKELRAKYSRRAFGVRKGDTVKIMNGEFKGKSGKIIAVDLIRLRASIEGIQMQKKEGSKVNVFIPVSNLLITELNLDDKMRVDSIKKENKTQVKEVKETKK